MALSRWNYMRGTALARKILRSDKVRKKAKDFRNASSFDKERWPRQEVDKKEEDKGYTCHVTYFDFLFNLPFFPFSLLPSNL